MNFNLHRSFGTICREGYKSRPARIMDVKDLTDECALIIEESVQTINLNNISEFEYRLLLSKIIMDKDKEGDYVSKIELRNDGFHGLPFIKLFKEDSFIGNQLYINGHPTLKGIIYSDAKNFFKDIKSISRFYEIKEIFEKYKNI